MKLFHVCTYIKIPISWDDLKALASDANIGEDFRDFREVYFTIFNSTEKVLKRFKQKQIKKYIVDLKTVLEEY